TTDPSEGYFAGEADGSPLGHLRVSSFGAGCSNPQSITQCTSSCPANLGLTGGTLSCINFTTTVGASTGNPNSTYSWSGPGIVSASNIATITVDLIGNYNVTASTPGCP